MDNLAKENEGQNTGEKVSGEIYSGEQESGYNQATSLEPESYTPETGYQEATQAGEAGNMPPTDEIGEPPPPFVEDNRKKYVIIAIFIIFILLVVLLISRFIKGRSVSTPTQEKISITYWGLWEEKEIFKVAIDEYQKQNQNVTIDYTMQDYKQYRERLQAAIDRGEGPDIFRFHNSWVPMLANYLAPMPKDIYSNEEFERTFYPVASKDLKIGENYHGIPLEIDGLLLFYNEDILKGANVSVPTTWIDVQNAVGKLTVKERGRIVTSAIALGTAENIEHFSDILGLMMLQNGTSIEKSLSTCADQNTTSCGVEALTFYRKFAETPNNSWDETLENSIIAFAGGKVAMIFAPSWQALVIKAINPDLKFKTAPVPQLPCESDPCPSVHWATYWVEGVSSKSKVQKEAWAFLKFLSQASTLEKLYAEQTKFRKLFGEPYSRVELGEKLAEDPYLASLISVAPNMKSFYLASRTFDGETGINTTLINYLKDAVNSLSAGASPETALQTADEGFKQVLTRFGLIAAPEQPAE